MPFASIPAFSCSSASSRLTLRPHSASMPYLSLTLHPFAPPTLSDASPFLASSPLSLIDQLMDGQYGTIAFIATQSDVLERSEAIRSLKLPQSTSLRECAVARNTYTERRLKQDFREGLRELAEQAGDSSFEPSKFDLPVFTVSSVEYQKLSGLRPTDGNSRVWGDIEETMSECPMAAALNFHLPLHPLHAVQIAHVPFPHLRPHSHPLVWPPHLFPPHPASLKGALSFLRGPQSLNWLGTCTAPPSHSAS